MGSEIFKYLSHPYCWPKQAKGREAEKAKKRAMEVLFSFIYALSCPTLFNTYCSLQILMPVLLKMTISL